MSIRRAMLGALGALSGAAGVRVRYHALERGASLCLVAVPTRAQYDQDDDGALVSWEEKDFLVKAEALVFDDDRYEPQRGDTITIEATGEVYEVLPADGFPPFRYMDPYRQCLRIHTKHVDDEAPR